MGSPTKPTVQFPMHVCGVDGVVFDERRGSWYGLPEIDSKLCCPICGSAMEVEPKEPPVRMFFCYQCGTTFDKQRTSWYGLAFHLPTAR